MEDNKSVERDIKRFEDNATSFEKTALLLGFVCFFISFWVRTPGLEVNPGSVVGLSIKGFNVGHAIVFGPILTAIISAIYLSQLNRRAALRSFVIDGNVKLTNQSALSPGDRFALANFMKAEASWTNYLADRGWKCLWYFVIPPLAAYMCLDRYADFVPDDAAKSGTFWDRVHFLFFDHNSWFIRPLLPSRVLEAENGKLMAELPYIYGPLQSWVELALVIITVFLSWRAARIYFANVNIPESEIQDRGTGLER